MLLLLPVFLVPFLYILGTEKFPDVAAEPGRLPDDRHEVVGNTEAVAWVALPRLPAPFEVASVFLLVAMVGAVVLGKRSAEKVD